MKRGYSDATKVMLENKGKVSHFTGEDLYVKYRDLEQPQEMMEL